MFICECGKLVRGKLREDIFKDYIETSQNPSTRTIGHKNCGLIFNFVDGNWPKKYSSKKELKILAATFAKSNNLCPEKVEKFLLEVDRLKSHGKFSDNHILVYAYHSIIEF